MLKIQLCVPMYNYILKYIKVVFLNFHDITVFTVFYYIFFKLFLFLLIILIYSM